MHQIVKLACAAAVGAAVAGTAVYAQMPPAGPPHSTVTIYRAATGQQEALLRWLADQDRASQAAGLPPGQIYIHLDGDSWDFVGITPTPTPAQDAATDAAATKLGLATGARRALEFRKMISSHTDTFALGPMTAAQAIAGIGR
jgi:hypothetical protein